MAGKLNVPSTVYGGQVGVAEAEYISPRGWVGSGSAQHGPGMILTSSWNVPWPQRFDHIKNSLGYSERRGGGIHRKLPRQHPHVAWLRATRVVAYEGVRWDGHSGGAVAGDSSDYEIARLTYTFESLPYRVKEDFEVKGEWERYVVDRAKPHCEFLSRDGFTWKYTEGPAGINAATFPGRQGVPITRLRLQWVWVQVPEDYILTPAGIPSNLLAGVNKINDAAFAGYPAQTLLFEDFDLEPRMEPVDTNQLADEGKVPRTFDVTLHITYFDPPQGGANRGWNNDPGPDWLWYETHAFKPDGSGNLTDSGNTKFQTFSFPRLFQGV